MASAEVTTALDGPTLRRALNAMLPRAIRVLHVEDREAGFHARFSAHTKSYEYRIVTGPVMNPFGQRYAWHVPFPLDGARMREAAGFLAGTHDFRAFRSTGTDVRTTVREVLASSIECSSLSAPDVSPGWAPHVAVPEGTLITYRVTGTGFLRHMVRAIVGTLVEVGAGRVQVAHIPALLAGGCARCCRSDRPGSRPLPRRRRLRRWPPGGWIPRRTRVVRLSPARRRGSPVAPEP